MWRGLKFWECDDASVVWQIQTPRHLSTEHKKIYLVISTQKPFIQLQLEKPSNIKLSGAIVNQVRKYAKTCAIGAPIDDRTQGTIWLPLYTPKAEGAELFLQVNIKSPREVRFIKDGYIMAAKSSSGTFTKKRPLENTSPDGEDITEKLLATLRIEENPAPDAVIDEEPPEVASTQAPLPQEQRKIKDKLLRKIKTTKKTVAKLEDQVPSAQQLADLTEKAELLKTYLYLVKPDMLELNLDATQTGTQKIAIALEPEIAAGSNLERYFIKLKKAKRSKDIVGGRLEKVRKELSAMQDHLEQLRTTPLQTDQLKLIAGRYDIALGQTPENLTTKKGANQSSAYYEFRLPEARILVGKSTKDSDMLVKQAKANDFWFHAINGTGSHVIIPQKDLKGELNESTKAAACQLALHFSKLKNDYRGEVYFSQKRHIRKPKGLVAGLWLVDKAETVFIKYSQADIDSIYKTKSS